MYSALAGIVSRTTRSSDAILGFLARCRVGLTSGVRRTLRELDRRLVANAVTDVADRHRLTRRELLGDDPDDVLGAAHIVAGDRDDHVAALRESRAEELVLLRACMQTGLGARRARMDVRDDGSMGDGVPEPLRDRRNQILG